MEVKQLVKIEMLLNLRMITIVIGMDSFLRLLNKHV